MEPPPPPQMKRKSICDPSAWKLQVIRISSTSGGHSKRIEQPFRFRRSASRSSSPLSQIDESHKSSSPNLNNPTKNRASDTVQPTTHENHSAPGGPAPRARDSANAKGWKGAFLCFNVICIV